LKQQENIVHINDGNSVEECLLDFKRIHCIVDLDVSDLRVKNITLKHSLSGIKNKPNNLQYAQAQAAYSMLQYHKR